MKEIDSLFMLVEEAKESQCKISDVVLKYEALNNETTIDHLIDKMQKSFQVMKESITSGYDPDLRSASGLVGGEAYRLQTSINDGKVPSDLIHKAMVKALATSGYNACMGRIVAAPTAGSCGIIPAVLITAMEEYKLDEDKVVRALFTSAGVGLVIAKKATISGAEGGCMAECGSAAAMAAAALVELLGGSPEAVSHAVAIALENILGLACDPISGLVEIPCVVRNASGASNAIISANLALAGINILVPADEVISIMDKVGKEMPQTLKETAEGGLASAPTARKIKL